MNIPRLTMIIAIASLAVIAVVVSFHGDVSANPPATALVDKAALARLQADLQNITPRFVNASNTNEQPLAPDLQTIKNDVVALYVSQQPSNADFYSQLWLDAIGKQYILLSQPIAESSHDIILDTQTGMSVPIGGDVRFYLTSTGKNLALYINSQDLYTYTLDQYGGVLMPASQLSGNETYDSGAADTLDVNPLESHTINSITISVFNTSKRVPNPTLGKGATMNKKVRDVTFSF